MKKVIFMLAVSTLFITGTLLTSCQSSAQKADAAQTKVQDAKEDLKEAQTDAAEATQKATIAEEWKVFKSESEVKITANEVRIAELKEKMKASGKTMDAVYAKNIEMLEQRNKDLKNRMDAYEKGQSDWASFKREFNHDMDELGVALRDLTVNNKK